MNYSCFVFLFVNYNDSLVSLVIMAVKKKAPFFKKKKKACGK